MEERHKVTIQRCIPSLMMIPQEEMDTIVESLMKKNVIYEEFVDRIMKNALFHTAGERQLEFFMQLRCRGPAAFLALVESLILVGREDLASMLMENESQEGFQKMLETCRSRRSNVKPLIKTTGSTSSLGSNSPRSPSESFSESSSENTNSGSGSNFPFVNPQVVSNTQGCGSAISTCIQGPSSPTQVLKELRIRDAAQYGPPLAGPVIINTPIQKAALYNQGLTNESDAYLMMSRPRGYALIINNLDFPTSSKCYRAGAEHDTDNLKLLFEDLGFQVTARHDVKRSELLNYSSGILKTFLDQFTDNPEVNACIVAIMSHGKNGLRIRTSDHGEQYVDFHDDILPRFNNVGCKALIGKPKIFVVQACLGDRRDRGVRNTAIDAGKKFVAPEEPEAEETSSRPEHCPSNEDIIVCSSTVPGYVSNRDTLLGTWYIRSLCEMFRKYAHELELHDLLKKVSQRIRMYSSEDKEKQMSAFSNYGFSRAFFFNPGLYVESSSGADENKIPGDAM